MSLQLLAHGQERGFRGLAGSHQVQQVAQVVADLEQQGHQFGIDAQFAVADPVQDAFGHVGEGNDMVQPEQAGGAFDGVRRPEDGVDGVRVFGALFDGEQGGFHLFEQFPSFDDEGLQGFFQVDGHGLTSGS